MMMVSGSRQTFEENVDRFTEYAATMGVNRSEAREIAGGSLATVGLPLGTDDTGWIPEAFRRIDALLELRRRQQIDAFKLTFWGTWPFSYIPKLVEWLNRRISKNIS